MDFYVHYTMDIKIQKNFEIKKYQVHYKNLAFLLTVYKFFTKSQPLVLFRQFLSYSKKRFFFIKRGFFRNFLTFPQNSYYESLRKDVNFLLSKESEYTVPPPGKKTEWVQIHPLSFLLIT